MEIKEIIAAARERLHIESLTPLQHKMAELPASLKAVAAVAPTGSGKTLAFALPLLKRVKGGTDRVEALVISPTRELTLQTAKVLSMLAPKLRVTALYGGHSVLDETRSLEGATPDVVVGTPGRILDHISRGRLDLFAVKVVVVDEYDKSLELGFQDEMRRIVRKVRRPQLVVLTSATRLDNLPDWLGAEGLLMLDFSADESAAPQICEYSVKSPEADKLQTLKALLLRLPRERAIVFVNHRESAERVFDFLKKSGFPVVLYHGALDQHDRETAVDLFANGTAPIMVATDLAARGLDIPQVRSVVHYHMPPSPETRVHRNGRAARMGAAGEAYFILAPGEDGPEKEFDADVEPCGWPRQSATLYFHAGKREKLSKGDIVGALTGPGELSAGQIGLIALHDHRALVAVPADVAAKVAASLSAARVKNKKIRVTVIK